MRRIRIQKPKSNGERRWLEVLPMEPRDLDVVRAKALDRSSVAVDREIPSDACNREGRTIR
jgi:hypothetical protein